MEIQIAEHARAQAFEKRRGPASPKGRGSRGGQHSRRGCGSNGGWLPTYPENCLPGALAFALPYEGVHINVFYDRVQQVIEPQLTPNVLAHVLVHEITHILQGTCRHSDTGVMKARWTHEDYMEMKVKPLSFTEEDVQFIRFGVAKRANGSALIAAVPNR